MKIKLHDPEPEVDGSEVHSPMFTISKPLHLNWIQLCRLKCKDLRL